MQLTLLKGKLHNAIVTEANLEYEGSVAIDIELMEKAGFVAHERVDIYNSTNGNRLTTYVIPAAAGSKMIGVQGAAAHLVNKGDKVIICAYAIMSEIEAKNYSPKVAIMDADNNIKNL